MSRLTRFIRSFSRRHDGWSEHSLLPLQQPHFPVAVCWSAKSGCTTVLKWFLAHNGLLDEAIAHSRWVHDYREDTLFHATGYRRQCQAIFKRARSGVTVVKVIRDPATRAVSSFLHVLRNMRDLDQWSVAKVLSQWKASVGLERQRGLSFRQFLQFVITQQANRDVLDCHVRPQYDKNQDPRVDVFIRLENLMLGLSEVEDRYGLPHIDLAELSQSGHHNPPSAAPGWPTPVAVFPADHDTLAKLGTPSAQDFLDQETAALIRTAYWSDYEAYGLHYAPAAATLQVPAAVGVHLQPSVRRAA